MEFSLEYGYSHSTSSTSQTTKKYQVNDSMSFIVPADQHKYVSVILYSDDNATAEVEMQLKLKGTLDGSPISGENLEKIAQAMSRTEVVAKDATSMTYSIKGKINANIVSHSDIVVEDKN